MQTLHPDSPTRALRAPAWRRFAVKLAGPAAVCAAAVGGCLALTPTDALAIPPLPVLPPLPGSPTEPTDPRCDPDAINMVDPSTICPNYNI